jgi:hypothetical protein|tara:strand:- start:209 stop:724 length:516 start_codon:yes stop_codon:yes gene_type:complete
MSEFKKAMEKYAKYVVQQARSNLSKGKNNASKQLYNSLNYEVKQNRTSGGQFATGYNAEFFMEEYGAYQDMGVHGAKSSYVENRKSPFRYTTKQPPTRAFDKWIKIKGIKGRDKKTGRFITDQSLKFLIARSIKNKGIRASLFFTKPFEAGINKYGDEIAGGFGDDVLKQL